ncbi:hypothetical protein ABZ641_35400, partial [Kitasatospora sp. NPDC007106]
MPLPSWCYDHPNGGVYGFRDQACELSTGWIRTWVTENGARKWTGEVYMDVISYEYTDKSQATWGHQIEIAGYWGWGDALNATVEGGTTASGSCSKVNSEFPAQGLSPLSTWRVGTSFYNTTATAPGAVGFCTTTWNLVFKTPGYNDIAQPYNRSNIRCDNAVPGNLKVGCVVYWHPSPVYYSRATNPTLANHVAQAQASGLPGAT